MTIWIITVGEPLPIDGEGTRLFRSSILTNFLVKRGHKVVRWTTAFNHVSKSYRYTEDTDVKINEHYTIKLLHSIGYEKNISLKRLIDHYLLAKKFKQLADKETKPDLILCSFPTIQWAKEATNFGFENKIPVILDARDMWPDIFVKALPAFLQSLARIITYPLFSATKSAFSKAVAITGMTQSYVDWGLSYANRKASNLDKPFPFGYVQNAYSDKEKEEATEYWNKLGIEKSPKKMYVTFVAYLGNVVDFDIIVEAAKILQVTNPNIEFVVAGNGEKEKEFKEKANGCFNIQFVGWIDGSKIGALLKESTVGLLPYKDRLDFRMSIPNKVPEYLAASLPVVATLKGTTADMLAQNACGFYAPNADELSNILSKIFDSPSLQNELSTNAQLTYQTHFNANKVYNDYVDYIESVEQVYKTNLK
jgi:glycosyltransferase involved in cell wall biosynthesis